MLINDIHSNLIIILDQRKRKPKESSRDDFQKEIEELKEELKRMKKNTEFSQKPTRSQRKPAVRK